MEWFSPRVKGMKEPKSCQKRWRPKREFSFVDDGNMGLTEAVERRGCIFGWQFFWNAVSSDDLGGIPRHGRWRGDRWLSAGNRALEGGDPKGA